MVITPTEGEWTVLAPIERQDKTAEELVLKAENAIREHIGQL